MGMSKRKLKEITIAGCLLCVFGIAALLEIKYQKPEHNKKENKTVITITFASGDEGWNQAVSLAGNIFSKKYPEISLKLRPSTKAPGGFYDDFLRKEVATDELGDIVELKNINTAIEYQMFIPLPKELTDLIQDTWIAPNYAIYTLPLIKLEQGLIYNKTVFDTLEIVPPKTWQEFESLCEKLKKKEYVPLVIGANDNWHLMFWGEYFFRSCITSFYPSWQKDCTLGTVSWTDKQPEEMVKRFSSLFKKGYVHKGYAGIGDAATCEYIANGRAVMLYALCNQIPKIQRMNPEIKLGWFFMPNDDGKKYSFYDNKTGWAITTECKADKKRYDAAIKFLKFFYSKEIYGEICNIMNALPVTKEDISIENDLLKEIKRQAETVVLLETKIGDENTPEGFESFLFQKLMELVEGKVNRKQVLKSLQKSWKSRVSNND